MPSAQGLGLRQNPLSVLVGLMLCCLILGQPVLAGDVPKPVRFLITFDDGPNSDANSPTVRILQQLKDNPVTPDIKTIFFVQTGVPSRGASPEGQAMMRQECAAGHILALHSATAAGHVPHTAFSASDLADALAAGKAAIAAQCALDWTLVRPPDWLYNDATLAAYQSAGMHMLLSDMSANDGKIYGWNMSFRRRSHFHAELENVKRALDAGRLPEQDDVHPVMVAFHDLNSFTASHMTDYLQILVEEAKAVGVPLADPPFYTDTAALDRAAHKRAFALLYVCDGVSRSATLMQHLFGTDAERYRGCI